MFTFFNKKKNMVAIFQATDNLAQKTCDVGSYIFCDQKDSVLNTSELTRIDAVIFATFLNYVHISSETENKKVILKVIDRYLISVGNILEEKGGCFEYRISSSTIRKIIGNRWDFYSKILFSKSSLPEIVIALCEGFECIIKTDIIEGEYKPLIKSSPTPILDYDKEACCKMAAQNFPSLIIKILEEPLGELLQLIK